MFWCYSHSLCGNLALLDSGGERVIGLWQFASQDKWLETRIGRLNTELFSRRRTLSCRFLWPLIRGVELLLLQSKRTVRVLLSPCGLLLAPDIVAGSVAHGNAK